MKLYLSGFTLSLFLGLPTALWAAPITFTHSQYSTTALAESDNQIDYPPTDLANSNTLPLLTSASAGQGNQRADATAIADQQFLATTASAYSIQSLSSAQAIATFTGEFLAPAGNLHLAFDLDTQATHPDANSLLAVTLIANGITLFNQLFDQSTLFMSDFFLPSNSLATIDFTLFTNANALENETFGLASLSFSLEAATVPAPRAISLYLAGIGILLLFMARKYRPSKTFTII